MKKLISIILATTLMTVACIPAMAVESTATESEATRLKKVETIAYMNVEGVSEEQKVEILEAREEIILSKSWVADGVSGRILDRNGNIKEELPEFSELFPDEWDMPIWNADTVEPMDSGDYYINPYFDDEVWLKEPPTDVGSPAFYSFSTSGFEGTASEYYVESVYTWGVYQNPTVDVTYNVAYTNATTGASLGYAIYLENGETFQVDPPAGINIAVKASTYDAVGYWGMHVDGKVVSV